MIARGATQICRATRREAPRGAARRQVSSESIVAIAIPKYGSTLQITSEHANLQMVQITCSFWDKNGYNILRLQHFKIFLPSLVLQCLTPHPFFGSNDLKLVTLARPVFLPPVASTWCLGIPLSALSRRNGDLCL